MNPEYSQRIEQLYFEMYDKLIAYARCSFEEESLAEEAVQETFQIACLKPDKLCESQNPRGWLVNTCKSSHSLRSSVYNPIKIKAETPSGNLPGYSADCLRVLF